jgi:hypothetical protein
MDDVTRIATVEQVARPTEFGELIPVSAVLLIWIGIMVQEGWVEALHYAWLLFLAVVLGSVLLMRLRYSPERLRRTIGPWRNEVDLTALQSIRWKMTGAWRSQGTILVRDEHGGRVGIYVGRFNKIDEWGPLLLGSAERSGATVDRHSRSILQSQPPN